MTKAITPNAHIVDYLNYYTAPENDLNFAVLLNGPWGAGKTHFVKEYFKTKLKSDPSADKNGNNGYLYISLFGVSSTAELNRCIFAAAYPLLSGRTADAIGGLARSLLGTVNFSLDIQPSQLKPIKRGQIIVADDLERCGMPLQPALGLLNNLIEHDGHKLILIGSERDISETDKKDYFAKREKIVGQVLTIRSDVNAAYEYFITKMNTDKGRSFFVENRETTLAIYNQSNANNLRVFQQSLWMFERVLSNLTSKHLEKQDGLLALFKLLFPLSIEHSLGKLSAEDIRGRLCGLRWAVKQLNGKKRKDTLAVDPFTTLDKKYAGLTLRNEMLSNTTLYGILVEGDIDAQKLHVELDESEYYVALQNEEPWRTVWWGRNRPKEAFESAQEQMLKAFDAYEYQEPGVILHVAMLRFWLAEMGYLPNDTIKLVQDAKSYIDKLSGRGAFAAEEPLLGEDRLDTDSHGLSFMNRDDPEFSDIRQHLLMRMSEAHEASRPEWAAKLLTTLKKGSREFLDSVALTNYGNNKFAREPVLHHIPPALFVDSVLALQHSDQDLSFLALKVRYEHNSLNGGLSAEAEWFEQTRVELKQRADRESGITKFRYELFDSLYFAPVLNQQLPLPNDLD